MTKTKVMIVEDESIVVKTIGKQLQKIGYEIAGTAASGEEAVELANQVETDLVLMDIRLAGEMDGIAAAKLITSQFDIPVVYLTAYTDNETLQRAKVTDPFGYIIKPFDPTKLHSTLEIALYKHRLEKKLRESELRFRTLATSAPVGIFQTDNDGLCMYVNKRWCEIAGVSLKEAQGEGWVSTLHPEDRRMVFDLWQDMVREGGDFSKEYRFQTSEGKITWVYGHAAALTDESGKKIGFIGTIADITDRKELEHELLTGKKLESIGILAGGIAHDFNNLLSVITGNISMLKSDDNISPQQYTMLDNMEKASSQAAELAHKLITFSKGGWLNRCPIMATDLVQQIIKKHFTAFSSTGDFRLDIPHDLPPIDGDELQLKQVFYNLILNSVEAVAANQQRQVTVKAESIPVPDAALPLKEGPYIKISISDNGGGISNEHLGKIFDPYFSTKAMGTQKGLGLGLTICYSIIRKHSGYIKVNSPTNTLENNGTCIDIYLPAHTHKVEPVKKEEEKPTVSGKILVMDDDAIIQDVIEQMLKRLGYESAIYDRGEEAIVAYQEAMSSDRPFDVLLLDLINKKGIGGKEALKKILKIDPAIAGNAIALSGFSDQSDLAELQQDGFTDMLLKPFKWKDLKQVVDRFFQN